MKHRPSGSANVLQRPVELTPLSGHMMLVEELNKVSFGLNEIAVFFSDDEYGA